MKTHKKHILIISIFLLALIIASQSIVAEDVVSTVEITPNNVTIKEGQAFDIDIYVILHQTTDTVAIDLLEWDPLLAKLNGVERGNLFTESTVWIGEKEINNKNGTAAWMVWGSSAPSAGEGTFAKLKFIALKDGVFSVHIPEGKVAVVRGGEPLQVSIIGENPIIQKSKESFSLALSNENIMLIGVICLGIIITALVVFYMRKKKRTVVKNYSPQKANEPIRITYNSKKINEQSRMDK